MMMSANESTVRAQRVLVIDDDAAFGEFAVEVLERAGFVSRFHRGPFGTLMAIKEMSCDLVLLDVSMPRLDGPMLMHMIRNAFGATRMRIFLCSGMTPGPLARIAREIGADGSITKDILDRAPREELWARLNEPTAPSQRSYRGRELFG
jgi:CheY-like chemotaxis protein